MGEPERGREERRLDRRQPGRVEAHRLPQRGPLRRALAKERARRPPGAADRGVQARRRPVKHGPRAGRGARGGGGGGARATRGATRPLEKK
ncbi:MAG: hypothetical protein CL844_03795 [Crocinitomicaceae bacterium]|nr:hypothetical protein [Crocinitomicaceae bacterium]